MKVTFFAEGDPKGQPRVKAYRRGGITGVYTPKSADGWKKQIAIAWNLYAKSEWSGTPTGPIWLCLTFQMPRPKSHFRKAGLKPGSPTHHAIKPDADNLAKALMDALTTLGVWSDDAQVCELTVVKRYVFDPGPGGFATPGCLIGIETLP